MASSKENMIPLTVLDDRDHETQACHKSYYFLICVIICVRPTGLSLNKKMEKILLVMCGATPTKNALNFACYLSDLTRSRLTGLFFNKEHFSQEPAVNVLSEATATGKIFIPQTIKTETIEGYMRAFEQVCENKGIPASVKYLEDSIPENIIAESEFSDLIIADASVSGISKTQDAPSPLLQHLLKSAQCPVLIAPSSFTPINEVVFCYDGHPSSVFAMKQLSYLLPEFGETKATVLQVNDSDIPTVERKRIINWLSQHFESSDIVTLKGGGEQTLFDYLLKKKSALIVMGAYGRSMVSRLFRHSYADLLIKTLPYPLFITHH
ncbi:hypothetical protein SAMN05660909_05510 [Chitinophaga terrae (ex Kim and Jung 2007)]|uniref:Universal stress protein n=1 Tax=Chitinophaga terrae (ex Kim and Jung 2007) TaxID=408074 RepID=A0A1H4GNS7_9BACT|nr:universal stress protein [Chitinophaga terrae (ex Kim and Jung 2007)]MDQ0110218.1 hypothetical protein [Chitinophaga terrae (ex Kim and Jung 2007)]SEB10670.1 hypothetical protein SAMN05660909_05510 [Chitinophaga terrae (ex Kim and Jung 2007)]